MHHRLPQLVLVAACTLALGACGKKDSAASQVEKAAALEAAKDIPNAMIEYRAALQIDPKLGEARLKLGDLYAQTSNAQAALHEYVRAADLLPDNLDAQLKAGAVLLLSNQFAEAKGRAENALKISPRNPGALTLLGNALAGLNDTEGAMDRLNEAIMLDPNQGPLYSNVGALQLARGDRQMAEASFKRAIRATPNKPEPRVALAHFYRSQGREAEAEAMLREALQVDPKSVQVNSNLAELFIRTGRPLEAELPLKAIADARQDPVSQFVLADYYSRTRRVKEAAAILDKLTATKETYGLAKARLAAISYSQGRAAEAHKLLDELLTKEPNNRNGLLLKARLLLIERKYDEALAMSKRALAADPDRSADAHFLSGQVYLGLGRTDEAIDEMKQTLKAEPRALSALVVLARIYSFKNDKKAALEFAQQAIVVAPEDPDARLTFVRIVLASGDTQRAAEEMHKLLVQFPKSPAVHIQAGAMAFAQRNAAGAREEFNKAMELDTASAEALAGLVTVDLSARNPRAALDRVESRLSAAPEDGRAWLLAARAYAMVGDTAQTHKALTKSLEIDPANLEAFAMLGDLYAMQGKLEDSLQQFQTWAKREPKSVAANTMVALVQERLNRFDDAKKSYEHILEIDPHAAVAANNLAWLHAERGGNLDLASDLAQVAKSQAPDHPSFNDTLGWIYYKKNLAEQAVPLFQQALEKDPNNALTHFHLGMAYAKLGEDSKAIASLKRALALDPKLSTADEARRTLADLQIS